MERHFSIVKNANGLFPELPENVNVLVFGRYADPVACTDYDGNMDRVPNVEGNDAWVVMATDFDTINAFHGLREKRGQHYYAFVNWRKAKMLEERTK